MDPVEFCSLARLVIVAGKGGVGKTTVSAALARMAASRKRMEDESRFSEYLQERTSSIGVK